MKAQYYWISIIAICALAALVQTFFPIFKKRKIEKIRSGNKGKLEELSVLIAEMEKHIATLQAIQRQENMKAVYEQVGVYAIMGKERFISQESRVLLYELLKKNQSLSFSDVEEVKNQTPEGISILQKSLQALEVLTGEMQRQKIMRSGGEP